ncbi:MAG: mevalonate kinase [Bacteroidota bacterium]
MSKIEKTQFPAKILLFGEYGIILGGLALTIPLKKFSGRLQFPPKGSSLPPSAAESNQVMTDYLAWLYKPEIRDRLRIPLDMLQMSRDLAKGLFFNSNIPQGYGAGSSGALVAALFMKYSGLSIRRSSKPEPAFVDTLMKQFSLMESWFHGNSSGLDPLGSLLARPLLSDSQKNLSFPDHPVIHPSFEVTFFIVDTGIRRNTRPLVDWFGQQVKEGNLNAELMMALSNQVVEAITNRNHMFFDHFLAQLSLFQLENMKPMVPDPLRDIWMKGVETGEWTLKLCGAGGGGYMLGFTRNYTETKIAFRKAGFKTFLPS